MRTLFLTSSPTGAYRSDVPPDFAGFDPSNGLADELRGRWKAGARCLLIAAFPESYAQNDQMREYFESILGQTGLACSCLDLCDGRNGREAVQALRSYDMLILGGGHVPTELAFFYSIGLPEQIRLFEGIVMGISAGSMNCSRIVYAQPEMPGEATDPSYQRFLPGLGLTQFNILPHYQAVKEDMVDGLRLMEEITFPDSRGHTFYAIPDGTYLLQDEKGAWLCGEAYRIRDGILQKVCEDNQRIRLDRDCRDRLFSGN